MFNRGVASSGRHSLSDDTISFNEDNDVDTISLKLYQAARGRNISEGSLDVVDFNIGGTNWDVINNTVDGKCDASGSSDNDNWRMAPRLLPNQFEEQFLPALLFFTFA